MRLDFDKLSFPAVSFKLDPGELDIELETGEKLPVDTVKVDLWHKSVMYTSSTDIPNEPAKITSASKEEIMRHAIDTVREKLGIPEFGTDGWGSECGWGIGWDRPNERYRHPEVSSYLSGKGCYLRLDLYSVA